MEASNSSKIPNSNEQILFQQGYDPSVMVPDAPLAANYVKGERPLASEVAKKEIRALRANIVTLNEAVATGSPQERAGAILRLSQAETELRNLERAYDNNFLRGSVNRDFVGSDFHVESRRASLDSLSPTSSGFDSSIPGDRPVGQESVAPDTETAVASPDTQAMRSEYLELDQQIAVLEQQLETFGPEQATEWGKVNRTLKDIRARKNTLGQQLTGIVDKGTVH